MTDFTQGRLEFTEVMTNTPEKIIIKSGAICSECDEYRARSVVDDLKSKGWNVEFGGMGRGSVLPYENEAFSADFYEAVDCAGKR